MQTVRIELDGDYAIVATEMLHRTTREIQKKMLLTLGTDAYAGLKAKIDSASADLKIKLLQDVKVDGIDDIIILNQTIAWSFADGKINQDVLDTMEQAKYEKLMAEVDKLYQPSPLPVRS